jgi:hypothetical protein
MKLLQTESSVEKAADQAAMSPKTARKYRRLQKVPSDLATPRDWRTRVDPFAGRWQEVLALLDASPGLQAKTIFEEMQRLHPGEFEDSQLRTLQRQIKSWRGLLGPSREVYFPQTHVPGDLGESDFTDMTTLGVTIQRELFRHLFFHFVLTYSNWETGTVCFSESFESFMNGLQNALWELGGVPKHHRTDRLSAAVVNAGTLRNFTERHQELLRHYGIDGQRTNPASANENGDVEQRHYRFKVAVDQALMLRGSREFSSREEYDVFLRALLKRLNQGRISRLQEELAVLGPLPPRRLPDHTKLGVRVGPSSTIRVAKNTYSVHSRLIGELIEVRLHSETIEVWYAQHLVDSMPRIRGSGRCRINYRHVIDWLVRKPGAFENYRYRDEMFPTSRFRMAYDHLKGQDPLRATKEYLRILEWAAKNSESLADEALARILAQERGIGLEAVVAEVAISQQDPSIADVEVSEISLAAYDALLTTQEVA